MRLLRLAPGLRARALAQPPRFVPATGRSRPRPAIPRAPLAPRGEDPLEGDTEVEGEVGLQVVVWLVATGRRQRLIAKHDRIARAVLAYADTGRQELAGRSLRVCVALRG